MGKRRSQRHKAKQDAAGGVKAGSGEANVGVGSENVVANAATFPSSCDDNSTEGDSFIGDLTMPMVGSTDNNSAIPESSPLLLSSCKDDVSGDVNPTTTGETIIQDDGSISVRTPLITNLSQPQSAIENKGKQTKSSISQRSSRKKATTRRGMEVWIDGSWVNVNDHLNDVESVVVGDASTGGENESWRSKLLRKISARCCCKQRS
jgi:hypothetical protein